MQPWSIDDAAAYRSARGERLEATELDRGLRIAFRLLPGGLGANVT